MDNGAYLTLHVNDGFLPLKRPLRMTWEPKFIVGFFVFVAFQVL